MKVASSLFTDARAWIFDLDNTLYPSDCQLFDQIDRRMTTFIEERLGLAPDAARTLQKRYYLEHGTTLGGLMAVDGLAPDDFLRFVHDIDLAPVPANPRLDRLIAALPGAKFVFTNGSVGHAQNVLARLGIGDHFDAIFDIARSGYVPKPRRAAFQRLIDDTGIEPARAVMFDDISRNLETAHALGMTTVWIRTETDWSAGASESSHDHIHFHTDNLTCFLDGVVPADLVRV